MQIQNHPIASQASLATYQLASWHFGATGVGKKAYIQASLHADEVPAMLVAQCLRRKLAALDEAGRMRGEIILVPAANPIGLAQVVHGTPFGRFDLATGQNFNRGFPHLAGQLQTTLAGQLGPDASANVSLIREQARHALAQWEPQDHTEVLKKTLLALAIDADYVLDMHCDNQALLHVYAGSPVLDQAAPLAALLGARALLSSDASGGEPFDEACSRLWWDLAAHFGPATPVPPACVAVTLELRGEMDLSYALAEQDADAIVQFLARAGLIDTDIAALPAARCEATPLTAVEPLRAPQAGVLVFLKQLGDTVAAGEAVADIVDPASGHTSTVHASQSGLLFASTAHRHLLRGMQICKIAGATPFRSGSLLSQ